MNDLTITPTEKRAIYAPGETVAGSIHWSLEKTPYSVELRLIWFTRGKGSQDVGIIDRLRFDRPEREDTHRFQFTLPALPLSFSGQLISLIWALELVAEPHETSTRVEFMLANDGREILLGSVPSSPHLIGKPIGIFPAR